MVHTIFSVPVHKTQPAVWKDLLHGHSVSTKWPPCSESCRDVWSKPHDAFLGQGRKVQCTSIPEPCWSRCMELRAWCPVWVSMVTPSCSNGLCLGRLCLGGCPVHPPVLTTWLSHQNSLQQGDLDAVWQLCTSIRAPAYSSLPYYPCKQGILPMVFISISDTGESPQIQDISHVPQFSLGVLSLLS